MKHIVLLVIAFFMVGCSTFPVIFGDEVKKVEVFDSKNQVIEKLGKPDTFEKTDNGLILGYLNKPISGWSYNYTNYYLIFNNKDQLISVKNDEIIDKSKDFTNALDSVNQNIQYQENLKALRNQQYIDNMNSQRPQKVIICKQGDFMCY